MNESGQRILAYLAAVEQERARRRLDSRLQDGVHAIKAFQHARFTRTYADLLCNPAYAKAALFFLNELYGPYDFSERDRQFERVVPALVRLFSDEIVQTVQLLAELHQLSEVFDSKMAAQNGSKELTEANYALAWRAVGEAASRNRQIELTLSIGHALDRYTRRPLMRHTLRAMRRPAQLAGLASLQRFLESGFDTFKELPSAKYFLDTVSSRERKLAAALFAGADSTDLRDQ